MSRLVIDSYFSKFGLVVARDQKYGATERTELAFDNPASELLQHKALDRNAGSHKTMQNTLVYKKIKASSKIPVFT